MASFEANEAHMGEQKISSFRWVAEAAPLPEIRNNRVAVILIGQGIRLGVNKDLVSKDPYKLNPISKFCTIAAGIVAREMTGKNNVTDLYIVSKNADSMERLLSENGFTDLKDKIIKNYRSGSTAAQAESLTELLREREYDHTILIVPSYHILRAKRVMEAYGMKINEVRNADNEYIKDPGIDEYRRARRKEEIENWHKSKFYNAEVIKEGILLAEQRIDKKQKIPGAIRKFKRKAKRG